MQIVINNVKFNYNIGCRVLKTKYGNTPFKGLEDIWDDIQPLSFKEITQLFNNLEQRRVAVGALGMERIVEEIEATVWKTETVEKKTTWVNKDGLVETITFKDTYDLYRVRAEVWAEGIENPWGATDVYFVKFKDTSTDREYMIWIDAMDVARVNRENSPYSSRDVENITPIQAIAWTFQTTVPVDGIEKIVRQGDCILVKKKEGVEEILTPRHLTEKEYRELLVLES